MATWTLQHLKVMFFYLAGLMWLDAYTTWVALTSHPGVFGEVNPVGRLAFGHVGLLTACVAKGFVGTLLAWSLSALIGWSKTGRRERAVIIGLWIGLAVVMTLVVGNNFRLLV